MTPEGGGAGATVPPTPVGRGPVLLLEAHLSAAAPPQRRGVCKDEANFTREMRGKAGKIIARARTLHVHANAFECRVVEWHASGHFGASSVKGAESAC